MQAFLSPVPPLPPGLGRNPLRQGRHPPGATRSRRGTQVLLDAAQSFAAEFNLNYSRWQGVKGTAVNEALNGKLGVRVPAPGHGGDQQGARGSLSPGMTGPTAPGAQGGPAGRGAPPRTCCGPASARWTSRPGGAYLSYYPRQTPFQGVHDRLYARALAVEGRRATPADRRGPRLLGLSQGVLGQGRTTSPPCAPRWAAHRIPRRTSCWPPATPTPHPRARTSPIWRRSSPAPAPGWRCWRGRSRRPWPGLGRAPPGGAAGDHRALPRRGLEPAHPHPRRAPGAPRRPAPDDQVLKEPRDDRVPLLLVSDATSLPGDPGHWRGLDGLHLPPHHRPGAAPRLGRLPGSGLRHRGAGAGGRGLPLLAGGLRGCGPCAGDDRLPGRVRLRAGPGRRGLRCLSLLEAPDIPHVLFPGYRQRGGGGPPPAPAGRAELAIRAAALQHEIRDAPDDATRREAIAAYRRVAEPLRLARLGTGPVRLEVQAVRLGEALIVACEGSCSWSTAPASRTPPPRT